MSDLDEQLDKLVVEIFSLYDKYYAEMIQLSVLLRKVLFLILLLLGLSLLLLLLPLLMRLLLFYCIALFLSGAK